LNICKKSAFIGLLFFFIALNSCSQETWIYSISAPDQSYSVYVKKPGKDLNGTVLQTGEAPWLYSPITNTSKDDLVVSFKKLPEELEVEFLDETGTITQQIYGSANSPLRVSAADDEIKFVLRFGLPEHWSGYFRFLGLSREELEQNLLSLRLDSKAEAFIAARFNNTFAYQGIELSGISASFNSKGLDFLLEAQNQQSSKSLELVYTNAQSNSFVQISSSSGSETRNFRLRSGAQRRLNLPLSFFSANSSIPFKLSFSAVPEQFFIRIVGADDEPIKKSTDSAQFIDPSVSPLYTEPGLIFENPSKNWRNSLFEVYRWDAIPETLIIDFKTRDIQDRFVKRLVFFLEKKGFRGSLLSNEELEGRHGWNANNFLPEDLARFFNKAQDEAFNLNPEEKDLRQALIAWGVLQLDAHNRLQGGPGGLLSLAKDMSEDTRRLLFNHEAMHGVFYKSEVLRTLSEDLWTHLDQNAKAFIQRYFDYMQYDVKDSYLMVNEYQAYLLQQAQVLLAPYLRTMAFRLGKGDAQLERYWTNIAEKGMPFLLEDAEKLRNCVVEEFGFSPGNLIQLEKSY